MSDATVKENTEKKADGTEPAVKRWLTNLEDNLISLAKPNEDQGKIVVGIVLSAIGCIMIYAALFSGKNQAEEPPALARVEQPVATPVSAPPLSQLFTTKEQTVKIVTVPAKSKKAATQEAEPEHTPTLDDLNKRLDEAGL